MTAIEQFGYYWTILFDSITRRCRANFKKHDYSITYIDRPKNFCANGYGNWIALKNHANSHNYL